MAGDFRAAIYSIDEGGGGSIAWPPLLQVAASVARCACVPGDLLAALCDRLKSEATYVVLNTLTALHTLCLNTQQPVHDQLAGSKVLKYLERLLNKPPFPGVEMAAAQLLIDWAFLYGQEELGHRSFAALTSTSKHRAMLQAMAASDTAVLLREDMQLGLPQFVSVLKGLDFQRHFATQLAAPLTSNAAAAAAGPGVASQLAKAAVAASYSGSAAAAAAAAAASRNTFAAWAERVQQDPQAAARKVLDSVSHVQADLDTLQAAQEACIAAARACSKQQPPSTSSSSQAAAAVSLDPGMLRLRHQLDKAYLAACKVGEWREMTEVLVQQRLPDTQLSALLSLADKINAVLDGWQQAATTEVFWLLGINTAGLADGSILPETVAAATAADAAAGAAAAAAAHPQAAAAATTTTTTPAAALAAAAASGGGGGGAASKLSPEQQLARQPGSGGLTRGSSSYLDLLTGDSAPALSSTNPFVSSGPVNANSSSSQGRALVQTASAPAAAAAAAAAAPPDELQRYLQELGVGPTTSSSSGSGGGSGSFRQHQQQQQQLPVRSLSHPVPSQLQQQQQLYPVIRQQQQQQAVSGSRLGAQQQQQHYPGAASAGPSSTGSAAAAAAAVAASAAAAAAAAAGDSGSSSGGDSSKAACSYSYTNPFAALDTNTIMKGLKGSVRTAGAAGGSSGSGSGSQGPDNRQQQQQQQQRRADLVSHPVVQEQPAAAELMTPLTPALAAPPAHHPQQHQQQQQSRSQLAQLQLKVQQLFAAAGATGSSPHRQQQLEAGVLQLLLEQQQHHNLQLQQMQQQHQQQVADIKAVAVQRFKELQQQLGAQQQQQS